MVSLRQHPRTTSVPEHGLYPFFAKPHHLLRLSYSFLVFFPLPVRYKRLSFSLPNMNTTQTEQIILSTQAEPPTAPQPRGGVGQDNPTPPRARTASPQPAPPKKAMRPHGMSTAHARSQNRPNRKRQTIHTTLHLKPRVRAELERVAHLEGLSVSATGAAIIEKWLLQNIQTQYATLLETSIDKFIGKHMRSYSTRLAVLLVRSLFASEQTRSLATNILGRQPGVSQPVLEEILNGSSQTAKRNITRITPQLADLLKEVEQWLKEGEKPRA